MNDRLHGALLVMCRRTLSSSLLLEQQIIKKTPSALLALTARSIFYSFPTALVCVYEGTQEHIKQPKFIYVVTGDDIGGIHSTRK